MNVTSAVSVVVEGAGDQVVAHVGLHALGRFEDRLGLGAGLSAAVTATGETDVIHDRGKVLSQAMLMLAGGGEACTDIEYLRVQAGLFGHVRSDSTLYRTFRRIDETTLAGLWEAMAEVRSRVWDRSAATTGTAEVIFRYRCVVGGDPLGEQDRDRPDLQGRLRFWPDVGASSDATGEALAGTCGRVTPGRTRSPITSRSSTPLVGRLPERIGVGHRRADSADLVARAVRVRTDSAGCSARFAAGCRDRNIGFSVVARSTSQIHAGISRVVDNTDCWADALHQDGEAREGAAVTEVTDLVDLSAWPAGTRLIVRREPLHIPAPKRACSRRWNTGNWSLHRRPLDHRRVGQPGGLRTKGSRT